MTLQEYDGVEPIYDSARRLDLRGALRAAWSRRELVAMLVRREVAARYQQAFLGAAWTLITPLAYAGALWLVFSHVARFKSGGAPYVVYVLSGVVVLTFCTQAMLVVAGAVARNTVALRRVPVPVWVFAAAAAGAAATSLVVMTLALLVVELASGHGLPLTVLALPVQMALLAIAVAGTGLAVGALAAVFADALEMARIALTLAGFLTPVFYPLAIVPDRYRIVVELNPLYPFLVVFRELAYGGRVGPSWALVACPGIAVLACGLGLLVFRRVRRALPATL